MQRTVYIKPETAYYHPTRYVMALIQRHTVDKINITDQLTDDCLVFDHAHEKSEPIAIDFYRRYEQKNLPLPSELFFADKPVMACGQNTNDLIATIFYMVNCLQERNSPPPDIDHYGRYKYVASYQYRFNCVEENLVLKYIHELLRQWNLEATPPQKSRVFLSHDIDALDGSWKHIAYYLLKQRRIKTAFKAIAQGLVHRPFFRNIPALLEYHREYKTNSTFFFIPAEGKGEYRIQNADYNINNETDLIALIKSSGNSLGLHKSSKISTLSEELENLPFETRYNRYHFLSHQPPVDWHRIEEANITVDASLGFAEHIGFRNSYGLPFHPYNPETKEAFVFLEVPLLIMDGTLWDYMGIPGKHISSYVNNFIERNKVDCMISILWHNTSLTEYPFPGLLPCFIDIMEHIRDSGMECLELDGICEKYQSVSPS